MGRNSQSRPGENLASHLASQGSRAGQACQNASGASNLSNRLKGLKESHTSHAGGVELLLGLAALRMAERLKHLRRHL